MQLYKINFAFFFDYSEFGGYKGEGNAIPSDI